MGFKNLRSPSTRRLQVFFAKWIIILKPALPFSFGDIRDIHCGSSSETNEKCQKTVERWGFSSVGGGDWRHHQEALTQDLGAEKRKKKTKNSCYISLTKPSRHDDYSPKKCVFKVLTHVNTLTVLRNSTSRCFPLQSLLSTPFRGDPSQEFRVLPTSTPKAQQGRFSSKETGERPPAFGEMDQSMSKTSGILLREFRWCLQDSSLGIEPTTLRFCLF